MKDFVEMKRKEQEAFLMPPILNEWQIARNNLNEFNDAD